MIYYQILGLYFAYKTTPGLLGILTCSVINQSAGRLSKHFYALLLLFCTWSHLLLFCIVPHGYSKNCKFQRHLDTTDLYVRTGAVILNDQKVNKSQNLPDHVVGKDFTISEGPWRRICKVRNQEVTKKCVAEVMLGLWDLGPLLAGRANVLDWYYANISL